MRHSLLKAKAGHDFTESQQQHLANVKLEFSRTRRQSERKRRAQMRGVMKQEETKRARMPDAIGGVKHDGGKQLQMKTCNGVPELETLHFSSVIQKLS